MEDFSSRYTFVRSLKNALIVHVLIILFLFLYYNPPSLLFTPDKDKETEKKETQVLIEFDREKPKPAPKPITQPQQALENIVIPLPSHTEEQNTPLELPTTPRTQAEEKPVTPIQAPEAPTPPKPEPAPLTPPVQKSIPDQLPPSQEGNEQGERAQEEHEHIIEKAPVMFDYTQQTAARGGKPRTFADLARGFMQHTQQENENNAPSGNAAQAQVQQILHDTYHAKVYALLKQAVNTERPQLYIHNTSNENATLLLKIARNGTLISVSIHHPAKKDDSCTMGTLAHDLQSIESTLGRIAKSVGLYPPLPTAFKANTISITFPIGINTQQGFYSYFMT